MSLRYVISIILCFAGSRQDFLSGVGYFPLDVFPRTCPLRTIYPTHVSPALFCHFSAWIRWFSSDVARSIKLLTYLLTYLFISLPLSVCQCDRTADNMKQKSYTPHPSSHFLPPILLQSHRRFLSVFQTRCYDRSILAVLVLMLFVLFLDRNPCLCSQDTVLK